MRDPDRITEMVIFLKTVWEQSPDMRLGQLVMNAAAYGNRMSNDIFYVEDDVVLAGLRQMLAKGEGETNDTSREG